MSQAGESYHYMFFDEIRLWHKDQERDHDGRMAYLASQRTTVMLKTDGRPDRVVELRCWKPRRRDGRRQNKAIITLVGGRTERVHSSRIRELPPDLAAMLTDRSGVV